MFAYATLNVQLTYTRFHFIIKYLDDFFNKYVVTIENL